MQKVVTLRASQGDLDEKLKEFTAKGWKIVSVTKGAELGRIGFSYNWTVVLEVPNGSAEKEIEKSKADLAKKSYGESVGVVVGVFAGLILLGLIIFGISTCI